MSIHTIAQNLRNIIASKEKSISEWNNTVLTETSDRVHRATIIGMLKGNVDELKPILHALQALRTAPEHEPWVKSYCGGKPNYTAPEEPRRSAANQTEGEDK
jgi:hypothetical protein